MERRTKMEMGETNVCNETYVFKNLGLHDPTLLMTCGVLCAKHDVSVTPIVIWTHNVARTNGQPATTVGSPSLDPLVATR